MTTARELYDLLARVPGDTEVLVGDRMLEIANVTYDDGCIVLDVPDDRDTPASTKFLTQDEEQEEA